MPELSGDFGAVATRSAATDRINEAMRKNNRTRMTPLTKLQRELTEKAGKVYIYNVSPIHEWQKPQGQLGTVIIPKCEKGKRISRPYMLNGIVNRWYDKGLGRKENFQESGLDIAHDICGCSPEFPADNADNNLVNYGVFITEKPFEELPKKEQEEVYEAAHAKMLTKLQDLILRGDLLHQTNPKWVGQIHRDALQAWNDIMGSKEERPWAPIRHTQTLDDCKFCGTKIKPGIVVCPNCRQVLDDEKFAKLGGKKAS
jgi:hypothetical protein